MGRGRGKGKKLTGAASREDPGSGNEEPLVPYKRRGRPQKPLKDDMDEEEVANAGEDEGDVEPSTPTQEAKGSSAVENGKRRRKQPLVKDDAEPLVGENGVSPSSMTEEPAKKIGFRQNGSRRKSKPRRAAEAGVEFR